MTSLLFSKNSVSIAGVLEVRLPMRYTPAGLPCVEGQLHHQSTQTLLGIAQHVSVGVEVVCFGALAQRLSALTAPTSGLATGFLRPQYRARAGVTARLQLVLEEFALLEADVLLAE